MKNKLPSLLVTLALLIPATLRAQSTTFTYQGHLNAGGAPATGLYEISFALYDAVTNGQAIGNAVTIAPVPVTNGLFTTTLDFGSGAFNGANRWLELSVTVFNTDQPVTRLNPRQPITPTPYAIHASSAGRLISANNLPVDFTVNGARAFRIEPTPNGLPNIIGGAQDNETGPGVEGSVIAGGSDNSIKAGESVIGGGIDNSIETNAYFSFIGGGNDSHILQGARSSTIGGGRNNFIWSDAAFATVAGGANNYVYGTFGAIGGGSQNIASGQFSSVAGGILNKARARSTSLGGGEENNVTAELATVAGGYKNTITGARSFIGGGEQNSVTNEYSVLSGGLGNTAGGYLSVVGGGNGNLTLGVSSTVAGGTDNHALEDYSTTGGGAGNTINAPYATIPGGLQAVARRYGQVAHASGQFATAGDAQTSTYVCRATTTDATQRELYLDESSQRIVLPQNATWTFDILITARTAGPASAGYQLRGVIENNAGTTALIGSINKTVLAEDTAAWDVTAVADDTNDALIIRVTGSSGADIRWVASVRTVEVIH